MAKIHKVRLGSSEFDAIEQEYQIASEDWNKYKLLDGGEVRVKLTVSKIYRIVDDKGHFLSDQNGDPRVIIRHKVDVSASE